MDEVIHEAIIKKIAEFEKRINENKSLIKESKILIFNFPSNYDCERDEMIIKVTNIHNGYAEFIKQILNDNGFVVTTMNYVDDYINYADCYVSKYVCLFA